MIPPEFETPIEEPPANPFTMTPNEGPGEDAAALGDALPDDPFALGAPAEDLPDDPFALGAPAEKLPAEPFALGREVAQTPAEDVIDLPPADPADLPGNPFAAAEALKPVRQEPVEADNAVEGDPEQFAEGLAVERAQAEVLALRTATAGEAAAEAAESWKPKPQQLPRQKRQQWPPNQSQSLSPSQSSRWTTRRSWPCWRFGLPKRKNFPHRTVWRCRQTAACS